VAKRLAFSSNFMVRWIMLTLRQAVDQLQSGHDLSADCIPEILGELLSSATADADRAQFLRALTDKGETAGELAGFVEAILPGAMAPGFTGTFEGRRLIDVCGTGGGGLNLFNVSTALMFVLAACDVPVVKHGNRGLSKTSGSSDVLQALGVPIDTPPEKVAEVLGDVGCVFLFAPVYHPAFKVLAPVRQLLGKEGRRTIFNLLGPLLNPTRPATQLMGTFRREGLPLFHQALAQLGRERFAVVYGEWADGRALGEVSSTGTTYAASNLDGLPAEAERLETGVPLEDLLVESADDSAERIRKVLDGEDTGAALGLLVENAAWALVVADRATTLEAARALASEAISSGAAAGRLAKAAGRA
jgi:anthranilate phosphoribosyltransferase